MKFGDLSWKYQAFGGETPPLDPKNAAAKDDEPVGDVDDEVRVDPPDGEAEEDGGDGEEEAKEGAQGSAPVHLHPGKFWNIQIQGSRSDKSQQVDWSELTGSGLQLW